MAVPVIFDGLDRYYWTIPTPGARIAVLTTDPPRLATMGNLSTNEFELCEVVSVRPLGGVVVKSKNEGEGILVEKTGCHALVYLEYPPIYPIALGLAGQEILAGAGWLTAFTRPRTPTLNPETG